MNIEFQYYVCHGVKGDLFGARLKLWFHQQRSDVQHSAAEPAEPSTDVTSSITGGQTGGLRTSRGLLLGWNVPKQNQKDLAGYVLLFIKFQDSSLIEPVLEENKKCILLGFQLGEPFNVALRAAINN